MDMEHDIVVHVWSDIACPWCWIGKHRLQKGIEQSGLKVGVEYHSYQLQPNAPQSATSSAAEHLAMAKGQKVEDVQKMFAQVSELAATEGLEMNYDKVQEVNTFLAHQLVYAAKARGETPEEAALLGANMFERLYVAHFTEGKNVANTDTLIEIAEEMGLDPEEVQAELEGGDHSDEVRGDIRDASTLGIQGVPFYVVGGKYGLSGAQPAEVFAQALTRAHQEMLEDAANDGDPEAAAKIKQDEASETK